MEQVEPNKQQIQHEEHEKLRNRWSKVQAMQAGDYKANKVNNNKSSNNNNINTKNNNVGVLETNKPAKKQQQHDKTMSPATSAAADDTGASVSASSKLTIIDEIQENDKLECIGRVLFDEKGDVWISYNGQDLRCGGDGIERRRKIVPTSKPGIYELGNCISDNSSNSRKRTKTKTEEKFDGFCSKDKVVQVGDGLKMPDFI